MIIDKIGKVCFKMANLVFRKVPIAWHLRRANAALADKGYTETQIARAKFKLLRKISKYH